MLSSIAPTACGVTDGSARSAAVQDTNATAAAIAMFDALISQSLDLFGDFAHSSYKYGIACTVPFAAQP
jgi:hypothetical protein